MADPLANPVFTPMTIPTRERSIPNAKHVVSFDAMKANEGAQPRRAR